MSNVLLKLINANLCDNASLHVGPFIRHGHHLRGKPPGVARSLRQRLDEENYKDPSIHYKVDIGLPSPKVSKSKLLQERLKHMKVNYNQAQLEKLARTHQLVVDLDKSNEDWLASVGPQHIKQIAQHYGVFEHLFGDAYFHPWVPLELLYTQGDLNYPVYYGNVLKPEQACDKPELSFPSDPDSLWSLVMTNPDGHLTDNESEYVHWFIGNIPGNQVEKGETIVEYLQPFPPKGTGYHRHVFILYKQNKKLDFSKYQSGGPTVNLHERTFKTYDFYRSLQDDITPAGLAFFQSDWTPSLKSFYHNTLGIKEPIYEYDFPPPYIRPQEWFPRRKPFNLYMDKYRDPKQINKEFLIRKLKNIHPFKTPEPPAPYPNAEYIDASVPSWLKLEIKKSRLKWGRVNDIE